MKLRLNRSGATAAEFVLLVPVLMALMLGAIQIGILFFANAGLNNAVSEAAREATLWPRRNEAQLRARLEARRFGLNPENLSTPVITFGTDAGQDFVDIQASYRVELNFGIFSIPAVTLDERRRAWLP